MVPGIIIRGSDKGFQTYRCDCRLFGEQFIIELKIWYGNEYNERSVQQLADYLDYYHKDRGYMISFNFSKNKKIGISAKTIIEAVV